MTVKNPHRAPVGLAKAATPGRLSATLAATLAKRGHPGGPPAVLRLVKRHPFPVPANARTPEADAQRLAAARVELLHLSHTCALLAAQVEALAAGRFAPLAERTRAPLAADAASLAVLFRAAEGACLALRSACGPGAGAADGGVGPEHC